MNKQFDLKKIYMSNRKKDLENIKKYLETDDYEKITIICYIALGSSDVLGSQEMKEYFETLMRYSFDKNRSRIVDIVERIDLSLI
ncbi:MAG TPA: hypothetical protein PLS66_01050 [Tepiditoga sp.]|nr:hypothetical protein [Tepiditoga sp.]